MPSIRARTVSEHHLAGGDARAFTFDPDARDGIPALAVERAIGIAQLDPQQDGNPGKVAVAGDELEPRPLAAARLG